MSMINTFRSVVRFRKPTLDPVERRLRRCVSVDDYRRVARRRLPRGVFDYIDGGAEDERTMRGNVDAFGRYEFRPRVLRDVSNLDTSVTILGRPASMPLIIAPTGYTRIAHSQGEFAVARAAQRAGIPYSLSTMGTRSIEDVATVCESDKWFQIYTWRDRPLVEELVARAKAAGYTTVWLTVDTAVLGRRERDVRRGFTLPPKIGPGTLVDGAIHPGWTLDFLRNEPIMFSNVVGRRELDGSTPISLAAKVAGHFDQSLSWNDIDWLRSIWDGPIVVKGIQTVADAEQAVSMGVEGIGLSNHGGRQLDDAPVPLELVEPVRDAVGGDVTIICDGGVRRGSDIVKAIALGADAVTVGRPYLYALGAAGERGVDQLLDFLREGMVRTMSLTGARTVAEIDRSLVAGKH
ncbi:MAG TPA: alpha-hydroxy acid oxidase [Ilumatobacteraceae bacterium]|nr:alpha-hydroxy acid oxidase [Ilumatobacteraceae bacterium]